MTIIAVIMLFFAKQNIQAQILNPDEIGNVKIEIPEELKSSMEAKEITDKNSTVHTKYSKKLKGYVNITADKKGNIIKITSPDSVPTDILFSNKQNTSTTLPCPHCIDDDGYDRECVIICIFTSIFSL